MAKRKIKLKMGGLYRLKCGAFIVPYSAGVHGFACRVVKEFERMSDGVHDCRYDLDSSHWWTTEGLYGGRQDQEDWGGHVLEEIKP